VQPISFDEALRRAVAEDPELRKIQSHRGRGSRDPGPRQLVRTSRAPRINEQQPSSREAESVAAASRQRWGARWAPRRECGHD
jgi:hypothetical protein